MIKEDNVKTVIAALDEDNRQYKHMRKISDSDVSPNSRKNSALISADNQQQAVHASQKLNQIVNTSGSS